MRKYPLLGTLFLLSILTSSCNKAKDSAKASSPPTQVQLQSLQTGTLQDSTDYIGTLEAEKTVNLKPEIQGRIQQILVPPGALVKRGDPIIILTPDQTVPQYNSAQAAVVAAIAARNTAAKTLQANKIAVVSSSGAISTRTSKQQAIPIPSAARSGRSRNGRHLCNKFESTGGPQFARLKIKSQLTKRISFKQKPMSVRLKQMQRLTR